MANKVKVDDELIIGGDEFIVIAGPCAVESEEQMDMIGKFLKRLGVKIIRGGAYKQELIQNLFKIGSKWIKNIKSYKGAIWI